MISPVDEWIRRVHRAHGISPCTELHAEIGALPMCGRPVPLIHADGASRDHVTYNTDDDNTPNEK